MEDNKLMKRKKAQTKLIRAILSPEVGSLVFAIILTVIVALNNNKFISVKNLLSILGNASFIGVVAIGQALIIMSGEMDLSVGNCGGFACTVFGIMACWYDMPAWLAILGGLGVAVCVGFLNGFLMLKVGIMKWVATLATSNLCAGLALYFAHGVPISPLPDAIKTFGKITINFGNNNKLSIHFLIFVGLVIVAELIIRYTKYGRMIQACGINSESASMAGVNVTRVKWITLIFVSILSYTGTFLSNAKQGMVSPSGLAGADFKTIASCYIGGIGFVGSSGSVLGLFLGVLLIQLLENAMSALAWEANAQLCCIGLLVMFVLILDVFKRRYMASRIDLI